MRRSGVGGGVLASGVADAPSAILGSMAAHLVISSGHNPRVRAALALREGRERRRQGRLLIDGSREIARAIAAGVVVREAFVARETVDAAGTVALEALRAVREGGADVVDVTPGVLARLAYGDRDEGIVVVAEIPDVALDRLALPARPLVAVIERVEKPGNLGAILRSADGAGVDAVIVADAATDPWHPNTIRASLGTLFTLPLAVATATQTAAWLADRGVGVVAAVVDAPLRYTDADLTRGVAIVVGSEADGLSSTWRGAGITAVHIPMLGMVDSLNVSVSAALLFYEARRQRGLSGGEPAATPA